MPSRVVTTWLVAASIAESVPPSSLATQTVPGHHSGVPGDRDVGRRVLATLAAAVDGYAGDSGSREKSYRCGTEEEPGRLEAGSV